jgi:hypothetical protein
MDGHLEQTRKTIRNLADFDSLESETILFFSHILTPAQRNYSTKEKEFSLYMLVYRNSGT